MPCQPATPSIPRAIAPPSFSQRKVSAIAATRCVSSNRHGGVRESGAVIQEKIADHALTWAIPESIVPNRKVCHLEISDDELNSAASTRAKKVQPTQKIRWPVFFYAQYVHMA